MCDPLKELIDQIAVRAVNFDAVETCRFRVLSALAISFDDSCDLGQFKGARRGVVPLWAQKRDMALGRNGARGDRKLSVQIQRMRDTPDMPELQENTAARLMNRVRDLPPAFDLLARPNTGRIGITDALRADDRRLRNDQPADARCT